MPTRFVSWILFAASSAALFPLTHMVWHESRNTCSSANPFFFIACCMNLFLAFGCWRHICGQNFPGGTLVFWSVSAIFHSAPFILTLQSGGRSILASLKELCRTWMSFLNSGQWLSLEGALPAYLLIVMPAAAAVSAWIIYFAVLDRQLGICRPVSLAPAKWPKWLWPLPLCAVISASICARHEIWWNDLRLLEHRTARSIWQSWRFYEIENPNVTVTNVAQLLATWSEDRVTDIEQKFLAYGRYGHCENSLYAKYSFVPPGVTGQFIRGELLVISTAPYPTGSDGELERMIISRAGPGHDGLICSELKEKWVTQLFTEAGRSLPVPPRVTSRSKAPMPLDVKLTQAIGLGPQWTTELLLAALLLLGIAIWWWGWHSVPNRS